jgi:hypothetical protein
MKSTQSACNPLDIAFRRLEIWNEQLDRQWSATLHADRYDSHAVVEKYAKEAIGREAALFRALDEHVAEVLATGPEKQPWSELLQPSRDYLATRSQRVFIKL